MRRLALFTLVVLGLLALSCGTYERRYDGDPVAEDNGNTGNNGIPDIPGDDDDISLGDDDDGTPLPEWSWVNDKGDTVNLYDYLGDVVLLNTGAGWCVPCREEAPLFEQDLYQKYKDDGFEIITLIVEDNENNAPSQQFLRQWREEYNLTYTVCADPDWTLLPYFTEASLPFTLIVDRNMVPQFSSHGYDKTVFQGLIEELL